MEATARRRPWVAGHRGAAAIAPENTAAAFREGIALGADAIEFDVRLAADGRVVVLHDFTLDRTTDGQGPVSARTWKYLERLDAGSWHSEAFRGERLLDLDSALALLRDRAKALVEIKAGETGGSRALHLPDRRLLDAVLAAVTRATRLEDVTLSSFHWPVLAAAAATLPSVPLALTVGLRRSGDPVEAALEIGARALHVNVRLCTSDLVDRARVSGLEVAAYVVNREPELRRVLDAGVAGVITDDPGTIAPLLPPPARRNLPPGR